eukprot:5305240-Alexandrium_andersonii.AAC.1
MPRPRRRASAPRRSGGPPPWEVPCAPPRRAPRRTLACSWRLKSRTSSSPAPASRAALACA